MKVNQWGKNFNGIIMERLEKIIKWKRTYLEKMSPPSDIYCPGMFYGCLMEACSIDEGFSSQDLVGTMIARKIY